MNTQNNLSMIKKILLFSLPIIAGQIGQMLFGIGDVLVASRYSNLAVASIGVASGIFAPFLVGGIGVLLCTGPLASQNKGSGHNDSKLLFNAYIVSLIIAIFMTIAIYLAPYYVVLFNLTPELVPNVIDYLQITSFSILPALLYQATKDYLQAQGRVYAPNIIIIVFNVVNVFLNYIFMFGIAGYEGFGIKGAAIATLVCRYLMAFTIFGYFISVDKLHIAVDKKIIKTIFKLGTPISVTMLCEVLGFVTVTVIVGGISLVASAAQSIVVNITSLTFMIPLGLGSAVSVLIGEEYGKKSLEGIKATANGALILTLINQVFFALMYLLIPTYIISLATTDAEVMAYAATLLLWVGFFQIPDGLQVVLSGVLRGLNETKFPMVLGLFAYWVVGIPVGYYFAFPKKMEASGLWLGLAIALTVMSILLGFFYINRLKKLRRLLA